MTSVDSEGVARLFLENVWRHHGLPNEIISDRGSAFVSKFSKALATLLGVGLTPSTAHHPQTDGQTERVNQEIETYLRVFINHRQDDWADWLPIAEFAYNNHIPPTAPPSNSILDSTPVWAWNFPAPPLLKPLMPS